MRPVTEDEVAELAQHLRDNDDREAWKAAFRSRTDLSSPAAPFEYFARVALEWVRAYTVDPTETEWGWSLPEGGPVPMRDETEARRFATEAFPGSLLYRRQVGPWYRVVTERDRALAAALRREAHEKECLVAGARGSAMVTLPESEQLRERADRLDGSGS